MCSDAELMRRVCDGDHGAFTQLVRRHTDRYFNLAYRTLNNQQDAEDVVQAAFIKLWQRPQSWRSEKSQFSTWFYRVVLNACRDHQRKYSRTANSDVSTMETLLPAERSEQSRLEAQQHHQERQRKLQAAMTNLPDSQLDALNLVVYCALPQRQAADVLGVSVKALESLLSRAKRSLGAQIARIPATD